MSKATKDAKQAEKRDARPPAHKNGASSAQHKVELVPTTSLTPYERNPMQHPPEQVELIVRSIKEYGFTVPLLCDENYMILAGHGRQLAALAMGMPQVPVIRKLGLTDLQKRAYVMADNKIARNAEFNWRTISEELRALEEAGFDLTLTGFRDFEFGPLLMADWTPPTPSDDALAQLDIHHITVTTAQKEWIDKAHALLNNKTADKKMTTGDALEILCRKFVSRAK
jgi:hypothetical protein